MTKKNKTWTTKEATSFIEFLDEYDLIEHIPDPIKSGDSWIYTIKLKIDDSNGERDNTSD